MYVPAMFSEKNVYMGSSAAFYYSVVECNNSKNYSKLHTLKNKISLLVLVASLNLQKLCYTLPIFTQFFHAARNARDVYTVRFLNKHFLCGLRKTLKLVMRRVIHTHRSCDTIALPTYMRSYSRMQKV